MREKLTIGGRCRCDLGWYGATCEQDRCFGAVLLEPAATGRFSSGAAADYAPMTMCTWAATAPPGVDAARLEGVMLRFLDFDLEAFGATSGTTDVLQLYATRADDPTDLEGATLVATFSALSVAALRAGDDDLDAAARPGVGVWVDGAGNFVQTFEETRSSGSLRDSLEAQPTWGNRLNSSTDSSGAIARPRSNLEPRLPHPSSP